MNVEPLLTMRGMKTVMDGRVIHHSVDLDLMPGEVVVLLGGSGAGKTTLLRTLVGLEHPVAGTCLFAGEDLFKLPAKAWPRVRTEIAYAFQGGALFDSLTVGENLEFPLREHGVKNAGERHARVTKQLEALGLGEIQSLKPSELSGGMQKRVGVARAIIMDPKIVLYDEPTAGLDPENVRRMNETIERLKAAGKTSIVVTHDPLCALVVADRLVYLHHGFVTASQTLADFRQNPDPILKAYFDGVAVAPKHGASHENRQH